MLNPFSMDPRDPSILDALQAQNAPGVASTAPAASPPPAPPVAGPSGEGGGIGGSIGGAISNMMSGAGLFGTSAGNDDKTDPNTGLSVGQSRRVNNQSLMKFGLMMLAAGSRQSDDSRAKILSTMGSALDNSDQINNFAKSRLETAKMKLLERQQLQEEAGRKAMNSFLGITPGPAIGGAGGVPVAAAPGIAAGATDPAATAPTAAPTAFGTPAPAPGVPAVPDASGGAPAAPSAPAAPPVELGPTVAQPIRAGIPAKIAPPNFKRDATPEEKQIVAMTPTLAAQAEAIRKWHDTRSQMEVEAHDKAYIDPDTNQKMVPVYKNGSYVGAKSFGGVTPTVADEGDKRITRTGTKVTGIHDIAEGPGEARVNQAEIGSLKSRAEDLEKQHYDVARPALENYDRVSKLRDIVKQGGAITGTLADQRRWMINSMASAGFLNKEAIDKLIATNQLDAELSRAGGEFAKKYYGPQISNMDVENATKAMGAALSGNKEVVADTLDRLGRGYKADVQKYQERADRHNTVLDKSKTVNETLREMYRAPAIDRKWDDEKQGSVNIPAASPEELRAAALAEIARRKGGK